MTFLTLQIRITLTDKHRVLIVKIRVQVPDTRTPDTHIITGTYVLRFADLHPQRDGRHQVTEIGMEILSRTDNIFHPLYGLFVAESRFESKVLISQRISGIGGQDMVQMTVIAAAVLVVCIIIAASCCLVKLIITGVPPEDILHAGFNRMQFADRCRIIHLKGLFHSIRLTVRMVIVQLQIFYQFIFSFIRKNIEISAIRITRLRLCVHLIRKRNHPLLVLLGSTLIINVSIYGEPRTFSMIVRPVAISNILVICSVHHGTTVAVTLITAAIHPESHRQQP